MPARISTPSLFGFYTPNSSRHSFSRPPANSLQSLFRTSYTVSQALIHSLSNFVSALLREGNSPKPDALLSTQLAAALDLFACPFAQQKANKFIEQVPDKTLKQLPRPEGKTLTRATTLYRVAPLLQKPITDLIMPTIWVDVGSAKRA